MPVPRTPHQQPSTAAKWALRLLQESALEGNQAGVTSGMITARVRSGKTRSRKSKSQGQRFRFLDSSFIISHSGWFCSVYGKFISHGLSYDYSLLLRFSVLTCNKCPPMLASSCTTSSYRSQNCSALAGAGSTNYKTATVPLNSSREPAIPLLALDASPG